MSCNECIGATFCWLATYTEPRNLKIRSPLVSLVKYFLLLVSIIIVIYLILHAGGQLKKSSVESAVKTKLFGVAKTNRSDVQGLKGRIWDNADYMIPPTDNGAFTVITSVLITPMQTQKNCPEDPSIEEALCSSDSDCTKDKPVHYGNGIMTGNCTKYDNTNVKVCEITAWCPVEIDDKSKRAFLATENFTVFVTNHVTFPVFGHDKIRDNIPDDMTDEELGDCVYDPHHPRNKNCPIFTISTIVQQAGSTFNEVALEGAVIEMVINWDCDLDKVNTECLPTYHFHRLDLVRHNLTKGFHMRYADHYRITSDTISRTLYRAYGIRVIVTVYGEGHKVDFVRFMKSFGSYLSYLVICSIIVSAGLGFLKCCFKDRQKVGYLRPMTKRNRSREEKREDDLVDDFFTFNDAACCMKRCPSLFPGLVSSAELQPIAQEDPSEKSYGTSHRSEEPDRHLN